MWRCALFSDGIITAGEDASCCVVGKDGSLLRRCEERERECVCGYVYMCVRVRVRVRVRVHACIYVCMCV